MRRGHLLRPLLISVLGLSLLLAFTWSPFLARPPAALAHAFVIGSDPVDGSTINTPPAVVRIFFNTPISPDSIAHVYVFAAGGPSDGQLVDAAHSTIPATNPRELDTPLITPALLPQGSYEVKWIAISNDDGHTTDGLIGFNIGHSITGLSGTPVLGPSTSNNFPQLNLQGILAVAWDWLVMVVLTVWIGILALQGIILRGERSESATGDRGEAPWRDWDRPGPGPIPTFFAQVRKQALPLQWLCLTALFAGEIINLILRATLLTQAINNGGIDPAAIRQLILDTNYGHLWLIRMALIAIAIAFLRWTARSTGTRFIAVGSRRRRTRSIQTGGRNSSNYSRLRQQVAQSQASNNEEQALQEVSTGRNTTPLEEHTKQNPEGSESAAATKSSDTSSGNEGHAEVGGASPAPTIFVPRSVVGARLAPAIANAAPSTSPRSTSALPGTQPHWHTLAWLVLAGLILLTLALSDEITQLAQAHISTVILDWLFLATQGIWFGGAAYLGLVLLPLLPVIDSDHHATSLLTLLRRYTPLALGAIAVYLVSSIFLAETSLSNVQQLVTDPFGRALLVKVILIALMLLLSGYALFFLRPQLHRQVILLPVVHAEMPARRTRQSALEQTEHKFRRTMNFLSWLGAGALLCAALMTFFAPPVVFPAINYGSSSNSTSPSTSAQAIQTKQVGNLTVNLQVQPARVNYDNDVIITINDSSGNPVSDAQVQVTTNMELMDMGTAHATIKGGKPAYIATFGRDEAFSMFGTWDIFLKIQRPNEATVQVAFQVTPAG